MHRGFSLHFNLTTFRFLGLRPQTFVILRFEGFSYYTLAFIFGKRPRMVQNITDLSGNVPFLGSGLTRFFRTCAYMGSIPSRRIPVSYKNPQIRLPSSGLLAHQPNLLRVAEFREHGAEGSQPLSRQVLDVLPLHLPRAKVTCGFPCWFHLPWFHLLWFSMVSCGFLWFAMVAHGFLRFHMVS